MLYSRCCEDGGAFLPGAGRALAGLHCRTFRSALAITDVPLKSRRRAGTLGAPFSCGERAVCLGDGCGVPCADLRRVLFWGFVDMCWQGTDVDVLKGRSQKRLPSRALKFLRDDYMAIKYEA